MKAGLRWKNFCHLCSHLPKYLLPLIDYSVIELLSLFQPRLPISCRPFGHHCVNKRNPMYI